MRNKLDTLARLRKYREQQQARRVAQARKACEQAQDLAQQLQQHQRELSAPRAGAPLSAAQLQADQRLYSRLDTLIAQQYNKVKNLSGKEQEQLRVLRRVVAARVGLERVLASRELERTTQEKRRQRRASAVRRTTPASSMLSE